MKFYDYFYLTESGNIFKSDPTSRINLADIGPTIKFLEDITGLPLADNLLGSTGKKPSSGDIDVGVNENGTSKEELINRLTTWVRSRGLNPDDYIRKSGICVHFKTPICGFANKGNVQTDFMFGKDLNWMKFMLVGSGEDSPFKGAHRHVLIASIARALGFKWSTTRGLILDGGKVFNDSNDIAYMLLGVGAKAADLYTVESILRKIKGREDYNEITEAARSTFAKEGLTLP